MTGLRAAFLALALAAPSLPGAAGDDPAWVGEPRAPQYFAVSVSDVDRAVAWYRGAFGLSVLDDTRADDDAWRIVNLVSDGLFVELIRDGRDADVERARGFRKVGFRVADVETVADRVHAATGERPRVLDFERHGVRLLQLRDPEGNVIQLTSPLDTEPPDTEDRR